MVEVGLLRKTEDDSRDDFAAALDFDEAFDRGFQLRLGAGGADEHGPEA
jgi:uncharacterized repeat protein (TIGR04138 family)